MQTRELREFLQTITSNLSEFGLISTIVIELIPQPKPFIGYIYGYCSGVKINNLVANDYKLSTLLCVIIRELEAMACDYSNGFADVEAWTDEQLMRRISELLTAYNRDNKVINVAINDLCVGNVLIIYS